MPAARTALPKWPAELPCDAVMNIQGDEPLIDPAVVDAVAARLARRRKCPLPPRPSTDPAEYGNPNVVKVVVNAAGRALYFSRRTIPYIRDAASGAEQIEAFPFLKHLGIYGYRRGTLLRLARIVKAFAKDNDKLVTTLVSLGGQIAQAPGHSIAWLHCPRARKRCRSCWVCCRRRFRSSLGLGRSSLQVGEDDRCRSRGEEERRRAAA